MKHDLQLVRDYIAKVGATAQTRLPPERDLAGELGITRTRLRGSLRKLAAEGLIWRHVGIGTFVGPEPKAGRELNTAARRIVLQASPREILHARLSFEPELARQAAFHSALTHHRVLRDCLTKMTGRAWNEAAEWGIWDARLHRTIAEASGNTLLLLMFETMSMPEQSKVWGDLRMKLQTRDRRAAANQEHVTLVEAICRRDPDAAAAAMRDHLRAVQSIIFGDKQ